MLVNNGQPKKVSIHIFLNHSPNALACVLPIKLYCYSSVFSLSAVNRWSADESSGSLV